MYKIISILTLLFASTQIATAGIAEKIVEKTLNKLGGKEKLNDINSMILKYDVITPSMKDTASSEMVLKDSAISVSSKIMGQPATIIWDGSKGWMKGKALRAPDWTQMPAQVYGQIANQYQFQRNILFSLIQNIEDTDTLGFGGMETLDGVSVQKIKLKPQATEMSPPITMYTYVGMEDNLIKQHKMIIDMSGNPQAQISEIEILIKVSDYKKVKDMMIPHKVELIQNGQSQIYVYNDIMINTDIPDSKFADPTVK